MSVADTVNTNTSALKGSRRVRKNKDIIYRDFVNFTGQMLTIQNKTEWGSYRPILRKIHEQLSALLTHHNKVLVMRFDFHVNPNRWQEDLFSKALRASNKKIIRLYNLKRIGYVWAREQSKNGSPHFHLMIAIDGNKANYPEKVFQVLKEEWEKLGQGGVHRCNHHMIQNTYDQTFKDAYLHVSYLAKIYSKDEQPKNKRNFGSSCLRKAERLRAA